jgi:hypothetical protein
MPDFKRILAIGDIHGEFKKLKLLLKKIKFNPWEELLVYPHGLSITRGQKFRCCWEIEKIRIGAPNPVFFAQK